jgi:cyclic pyranopterin phosphate synthase
MDAGLSHVGADGRSHMVDVGSKPLTRRVATAESRVRMKPETRRLALAGGGPKGPVLEVARLAGVMGAKHTATLVPLCHPLPLDSVEVEITPEGDDLLVVRATACATWRTGVEMEALTAVTVAGLTLVDMLKAVDRELVISDVRLLEKSGGRSGSWRRDERGGGA